MKNAFCGLVSSFNEVEERLKEFVKLIKNPATNNVTVIMSTVQSKITRHIKKQDNMTGRKKFNRSRLRNDTKLIDKDGETIIIPISYM